MVESSQERAKRNTEEKKQCSKKYTKKPALLFCVLWQHWQF